MDKRDIKRIQMKFGKFLDPFAIVAVVAIFSLSALSLVNLSPRTYTGFQKDVLGATTEETEFNVNIEKVGGKHNYISNEQLNKISPTHYVYKAKISSMGTGQYSKPIFKIAATGLQSQNLDFELLYSDSSKTKISLMDKSSNISYVLKDSNGKIYKQSTKVPNQETEYYLVLENPSYTFFDQIVEIRIFITN